MLTYLTASIALLPLLAHAGFANTHALMAFSDKASANLESLRPYSAAASQAHQIKLAASKGEECIDALIVSAPSFGVNDIALLPQDSVIRYEMERAQTSLTLPYVQGRAIENLKDMIGRRFAGCDTQTTFRTARQFVKIHPNSRKEWLAGLGMRIHLYGLKCCTDCFLCHRPSRTRIPGRAANITPNRSHLFCARPGQALPAKASDQ